MYQIGWWDESHRKCCLKTIQGANGCEYITRVKRDEFGNPSLDGCTSKDSPVNVNVKYEKEVRFALGVALVKLHNGEVEGRRIPCFEYTEQTIVAHKDWIRKYDDYIRHIKDLTTEQKDWVNDPKNGRIFENDADLTMLSGL